MAVQRRQLLKPDPGQLETQVVFPEPKLKPEMQEEQVETEAQTPQYWIVQKAATHEVTPLVVVRA